MYIKGKSMMNRLALVSGGTRGIGAAISCALQQKGYQVVATYSSNAETAQNFSNQTKIPVYCWDVSKFDDCQKGITEVVAKHGPIEILINNAGIADDSMFHKMAIESWESVISINLNSCFNMTRCVIESMRERGYGRIISLSSINGQKGQTGQTNYAAAKAGIIGFTKALALENATKGITVNAIAPGYIGTEMMNSMPEAILSAIINQIPVKRLGFVSEIAHAVVFLADDNAAFITGEVLNINGGQYLG